MLYYSAEQAGYDGRQCVGAATAVGARSVFNPEPTPIACSTEQGGAVDPAGFVDTDGTGSSRVVEELGSLTIHVRTVYVLWKVNGNTIGHGGECNNEVEPIVPTVSSGEALTDDTRIVH